jgi:c(7)-type cytochrome triheme protein
MLMIGLHPSRVIAIGMVLLAIVVGCVAEPAQQPVTAQPEAAMPGDANIQPQPASGAPPSGGTVTLPASPAVNQSNESVNADEEVIVRGKKLSIPKITGSVHPRDDRYHDTDNNAIAVLQSPTEAMADFPRDRRNEVDWVKTLDQGLIEPRADLKGETKMTTMDKDILMKNTQFMPWVRFPHMAHTKWLACENCHPRIFIPQEDANPISMNKVLSGEYCGICHDKVAFSLFICERCHSVPHEGSGPAWWK